MSVSVLGGLFPTAPEWQPILLGAMLKQLGKTSWALGPSRADHLAEIERRLLTYGLPPLRLADSWPSNYLFAMRVATWARQAGRVKEFVLAAYRRAFVVGEDLAAPDVVLHVAYEAGLDSVEAKARAESLAVKDALRIATERALALGVTGVPTVLVGDRLFFGDDRLDDAAAAAR